MCIVEASLCITFFIYTEKMFENCIFNFIVLFFKNTHQHIIHTITSKKLMYMTFTTCYKVKSGLIHLSTYLSRKWIRTAIIMCVGACRVCKMKNTT